MAEEESKVLKKRGVESLGWITETSIMPRKHRVIEGVGASSILELKAQLYKSQEDSKRQPKEPIHSADHQYSQHLEVHRAKKKISANDGFSHKNAGVEARAAKDKLELKSVQDGSASYAALEKKAELYDKLVRGEISDEEEQEKYSVDFFRKGLEHDHRGPTEIPTPVAPETSGGEGDENTPTYKDTKLGRVSGSIDRSQQKQFVMEVHEEVKQAREKVSEIKLRRQEQTAAKREKLMKAYLKMQLEKKKKKDASMEP